MLLQNSNNSKFVTFHKRCHENSKKEAVFMKNDPSNCKNMETQTQILTENEDYQ